MEITYTHAAGLDIHKKTVVACCFTPGPTGTPQKETCTFGTMTQDLLALAAWLTCKGVTHVALMCLEQKQQGGGLRHSLYLT